MSDKQTTVLDEILTERHRQMHQKGWNLQHDDEHTAGEIIGDPTWGAAARLRRPTRENLIKAAALIVAEVERMDRADAERSGA